MAEEFSMNIALRQGNALNPLMFIMVMMLVNRKVSLRSSMERMLYADDLAVMVESGREMQEVLGKWNEAFGKHWLKMSMEKTEVMWVGQQRKEMNIRLEGKEIRQGHRFEVSGGNSDRGW